MLKPCALVGSAAVALWVTFETAGIKLAEAAPERQLIGEGSVSPLDYADYLLAGTAGFAAVGAVVLGVVGYIAKQIHNAEKANDELLDRCSPTTALPPTFLAELLPPTAPNLQSQQSPQPTKLSDLLAAQA